jgi:hypothetical protein
MRLNSIVARRAAVILLIPVFLVAGCQKQNNAQQRHEQQTHEKFAGGGRQKIRAVCADDIQKYCANADKKRRCLRENMDKLSDACKAAVGQRGGRRARDNDGGDD